MRATACVVQDHEAYRQQQLQEIKRMQRENKERLERSIKAAQEADDAGSETLLALQEQKGTSPRFDA